MTFSKDKLSISIVGYIDPDYKRDLDKKKSLTNYVFTLFDSASVGNGRQLCKSSITLCIIKVEYVTGISEKDYMVTDLDQIKHAVARHYFILNIVFKRIVDVKKKHVYT